MLHVQEVLPFFIYDLSLAFYFTDALSTSGVVQHMSLEKLTSRKWYVQGTCATNGEGIYEAMSQLSTMVREFKKGRNSPYWYNT